MRYHYEDAPEFAADAYTIGEPDVAWRVWGWHTEPTEDTEWSGFEERTGMLVCAMVGDDCQYLFDPADVTELPREDYCGSCGQVGCCHDGLDRSA